MCHCVVFKLSLIGQKTDSPKMDKYDKLEDSRIILGPLFRLAVKQGSHFQRIN